MNELFNRVDFKAGLFAFICVGFIMLIEGFLSYQEVESRMLEDFTKNSQTTTAAMAHAMEFALWDFDTESIKEIVSGLDENDSIIASSVTHTNGEIVSQVTYRDYPVAENNTLKLESNMLSPLDETIGVLTIDFTLEALNSKMKNYVFSMVFKGLVVSTLVYLVIALTLGWITMPLRNLKESVRSYNGSQKLTTIEGLERKDEIGALARGFKQIADQIHENVVDLEERVEQRTFDLVEAVEKAAAANKAKSAFLANMSHEIRTPMNGVLGMAQVLQGTQLNEKQRAFVKTIYDSGSALLTIINDILDYSKIEAGKVALDPAPFFIGDAVEDVATLLGSTARSKDLELMVRIQPELPRRYMGDVGRIRQIITNLVGNAIKFTHEGSVIINVSGEPEKDFMDLKIAIQDTGIGLAPDKLNVIFDEFNQAENSTTRKFGGTGLGLSITKSLVEVMGGDISVTSELGKGSKFTVSIRLKVLEDDVTREPPEYSFNNEYVLVVDDNEVNRNILKEVLISWNLKPIFADGAKKALLLLRQAEQQAMDVSIILTDYNMPDYDGVDLVRAIGKMPKSSNIPIIALSSSSGEEVASDFKKYGVSEVFVKPIRVPLLNNAIQSLLMEKSLDNNIEQLQQVVETYHEQSEAPIHPDQEQSYDQKQNRDQEKRYEVVPQEIHDKPKDNKPTNTILENAPSNKKRKILVTDDNDINREVLGFMIDDTIYDVDFAEDGKKAFELAKENRYEMIFMDISMPVMDGIESTKAIRAFELEYNLPETPIIATTAHAMRGDKERMLEQGMSDYLSKPVAHAQLDEMLEKWNPKAQNSPLAAAS